MYYEDKDGALRLILHVRRREDGTALLVLWPGEEVVLPPYDAFRLANDVRVFCPAGY